MAFGIDDVGVWAATQIGKGWFNSFFGKKKNLGPGDVDPSTYYSGNSMFPTKGQGGFGGLPGVGGSKMPDLSGILGGMSLPGMGGGESGGKLSGIWDWIKKNPEVSAKILSGLFSIPDRMQNYKQAGLNNAMTQAYITRLAKDQQTKDAARKGLQMMLSVNPYSKQIPKNLGSVFNY